jgi:hypothetical protein
MSIKQDLSLAFRVFSWMPSFLEERSLNIKHSDETCTPILSVSVLKSAFSVILHTGPEQLLSFTVSFVICAKVYMWMADTFLHGRCQPICELPHGGPGMIVCVVSPLMVLTILTASYEDTQLDNLLTKKPTVYAFRDVRRLRRSWKYDLTKIRMCL